MHFDFHPEARAEYLDAIEFYEERRLGLGAELTKEVEAAIESIIESPYRYRILAGGVRRRLLGKFPYGILYSVEDDFVLIVAVMHCSRKPGYWRSRRFG